VAKLTEQILARRLPSTRPGNDSSGVTRTFGGGRDSTLRAILIFAFLTSYGCSLLPSHIHNPDRATRTAKLASLVDQYGDKSPGIYDTLLKSSRTVASEQDKVLAGLTANRTEALTDQLPFQTGKGLATLSSSVCSSLNQTRSNLTIAMNTYLSEKTGAEQSAKTAEEAIKAAQLQVAAAQESVTDWNATTAVLEAGVAELPSANESPHDNKQLGLADLEKAVQAAGDKQVQYADADGKTQKRKISDILKDQINVSGKGKPLLNIPDAPGATLTILTLGVQLANVQKHAAEAKLAQLSRRLELYARVEAEAELAKALLSDAGDSCQSQLVSLIVRADRSFVVETSLLADEGQAEEQAVAEAAKSIGTEGEQQREQRLVPKIQIANRRVLALTSDLIKLRELATAEAVATRTSLDLAVNEPRLAHEESILDSQVNDVAWRAVIRSGVVVLDQYEQGGFTAQDAADIIAIAQAIAVGVIAGRVP
jgi:hypothetical protein